MAIVTLILTDVINTVPHDAKSYVRLQLSSNPDVKDGSKLEDLTLAQLMGRVAAAAVVEALEKHFNGHPSHTHDKPEN
jgi:hypothetical protein